MAGAQGYRHFGEPSGEARRPRVGRGVGNDDMRLDLPEQPRQGKNGNGAIEAAGKGEGDDFQAVTRGELGETGFRMAYDADLVTAPRKQGRFPKYAQYLAAGAAAGFGMEDGERGEIVFRHTDRFCGAKAVSCMVQVSGQEPRVVGRL